MKLSRLFSFIIIYFFFVYAKGQQPYMWHISDEQGLPSNEVYNIYQDKKGYVWIGTDNGLCRYDGKNYKKYSHPNQSGRAISYFEEDSKGRIWCSNFSGQIFYIQNDSLHLLKSWDSMNKNGFPRYTIDSHDNLWIVSNGNPLLKYIPETDKYISFNLELEKMGVGLPYAVGQPVMAHDGRVILSNNSLGILLYDEKNIENIKSAEIEHQSNKQRDILYNDFMVVSTGDKQFYIGKSSKKVFFIDDGRLRPAAFNHYLMATNTQLINIFCSKNGGYYIATFDGIYYFSNENAPPQKYLNGEQVSFMIEDKEGNTFFTTLKNGVYVMPTNKIRLIDASLNLKEFSTVNRICTDGNGKVYLGKNNGNIDIYDGESMVLLGNIDLNVKKECESFYYNPYTQKLYIYALNLFEIPLINPNQKQKVSGGSLKDLYIIKNGISFRSQPDGAFIVCKVKDKALIPNLDIWEQNYKSIIENYNGENYLYIQIRNQRSRAIYLNESSQILYVAYADGLKYYIKGKEYNLRDEQGEEIFAYQLQMDNNGLLWAATSNKGLLAIKRTQICKTVNTKNGLASNFVKRITLYNNNVWGVNENTLFYYNVSTNKITHITKEDGLLSADISDLAVSGDNLWIATAKGIQVLPVNYIHVNSISPPIYINSVSIDEKEKKDSEVYNLAYDENNIKIEFTGISITSQGKFIYKYRMLGLDSNWLTTSSDNNFVRYPSLPPGEYIFEVKAVNEDGYESIKPAVLHISISKPFWQRWWFYILLLLSVTGIISLIYYIRIRSLNRNAKLELSKSLLEQNLRASELTALKAQMNPHFIFNALNSIQEFILLNEKKTAQLYLGKFSSLMRLYLDMSQKQSVSLDEEMQALQLYLELEALRFEDTFSYIFNCDEDILQAKLPPMLIQPYAENALKHGLLHRKIERKLLIKIYKESDKIITCIIEDNGIGRAASLEINKSRSKTFASFSTGATARRLELLNNNREKPIGVLYKDLYNSDGSSAGTRVTLSIPFER